MKKIIITGLHGSGKQEILNLLKEDGFKCGSIFSNITDNNLNNNLYEYYSDKVINEIFENKAYMYIKQIKNNLDLNTYYEVITKDNWEENQIFALNADIVTNFNDFKDDVIYVWLDNNWSNRYNRFKSENRNYNFDFLEREQSKYINDFYDRVYNSKNSNIIYFNNEEPIRIKSIIKAILLHEDMEKEFLNTYNN